MGRPRIILFAFAGTMALVGAVWCCRPGSDPIVHGYLRSEDIPQIQRAIQRDRWEVSKSSLESGHLKVFLSMCIPDTAFGRVQEIGSLPNRSINGFGSSITNPSKCAYVLSSSWCSRGSDKYALERTTNGWEVTSFGYQP
jgi:hypothetical protein